MKQNINSVFMGKPGTARFLFCALLLMFCLPFVSQAQDTGSITGTVRDVSGSVVPGADVQVSSAAIGLTRAIATNGDGDYLAGALPAGTYELSVTAKGFKSFTARGIILQVAEKKRVDVALQLGEISEKVIVEGVSVERRSGRDAVLRSLRRRHRQRNQPIGIERPQLRPARRPRSRRQQSNRSGFRRSRPQSKHFV